jgi:hypothetical protein
VCVVVKSHVLFVVNFLHVESPKKKKFKGGGCKSCKGFFFFEKMAQSHHILRKKSLKSADFDYSLLPKYSTCSKKRFYFPVGRVAKCWLSPLVDDC